MCTFLLLSIFLILSVLVTPTDKDNISIYVPSSSASCIFPFIFANTLITLHTWLFSTHSDLLGFCALHLISYMLLQPVICLSHIYKDVIGVISFSHVCMFTNVFCKIL